MSVKRYSGRATITLRLDDWGDYHYSVSVGGRVMAKGAARPSAFGFGPGVAYDSPKAYDEMAQTALSFAIHDKRDIGDEVDYAQEGTDYIITRRKPIRSAAKNGRSRLKRTKLACTRRSNATRKGSSKAASRLATHCPRRRSTKNGRKTITTEWYSPSVTVDTIRAKDVKVGDVLIPWQSRDGRDTVVDIKRGKRLYEFLVKRGDVIDPFSYELTLMQNPMDEFKIDLAASGRPVPKRRMAKAK